MEAILLAFGGDIIQGPAEIDITTIPDGVYTGEGKGLMPGIKVEVTVEGGKITNIEVLAGEDTPEYFNQAKAQIPKRLSSNRSLKLMRPVVLPSAVKVLWKLCAMPCREQQVHLLNVSLIFPPFLMVFTGEGKGLKPGIKVEVTVEGGKITNIEVLAGEDTPEYFNQAKAQVPKRIIESSQCKLMQPVVPLSAVKASWML